HLQKTLTQAGTYPGPPKQVPVCKPYSLWAVKPASNHHLYAVFRYSFSPGFIFISSTVTGSRRDGMKNPAQTAPTRTTEATNQNANGTSGHDRGSPLGAKEAISPRSARSARSSRAKRSAC